MSEAERKLARDVLQKLLRRIVSDDQTAQHPPYEVSHAWTEGPTIFVVYKAPPSTGTWGMVRDTRQSIVDVGAWHSTDDPALYYYLIDFEENQPSSSPRPSDDPDKIWWFGYPREGLPQHLADLSDDHRYESPVTADVSVVDPVARLDPEPRRYGDPI